MTNRRYSQLSGTDRGVIMLLRTKSLLRMLLTLCLLLCLSFKAESQTRSKGTLQGQVRLGEQGRQAQNALVIAYGDYEKVYGRTNERGEFRLTLSKGRWRVEAVVRGYQQSSEVWGSVVEGRTNSVSPNPIILVPNPNLSSSTRGTPQSKHTTSVRFVQAAHKTGPPSPSGSSTINRSRWRQGFIARAERVG
jgi:hypothetical protein